MEQATVTDPTATPTARMMALLWPGALVTQAICTGARLGIADIVADGPRTADDIATAAKANGPAVLRLLRALTSLGIFRENDDGRFAQTPLSATLRAGSTVHPWAIMLGAPFMWRPWGELYDSVISGQTAFCEVFGRSFSEYMAENPAEAEIYNTAMDAGSAMNVSAVVSAYDFSRVKLIVDVGGGRGTLLAGILEANPQAHGVLYDLPAVVAGAEALRTDSLARRCTIEGGDFFERVPAGDLLILKSIIHAWSDQEAEQILQNCRRALPQGGRLLLLETVLAPSNEPNPQKALMDLIMFSLVSGHERTEAEFKELLEKAGFELLRIIPTERAATIIEAA